MKLNILFSLSVLLIFSTLQAKSQQTNVFGATHYSNIFHTETIPNALFVMGDIRKGDSFNFRKATRERDIEVVVLLSQGGDLYEGLRLGGMIKDKGLSTFIPRLGLLKGGVCASACAYMYFAGKNRLARGALGVHQFFKVDSDDKISAKDAIKMSQEIVADIVGFLNEFEAPGFVAERMFSTKGIYYFTDTELAQIDEQGGPLTDEFVEAVDDLINLIRAAYKKEEEKTSQNSGSANAKSSSGLYKVQLGAFKNKQGAINLWAKLSKDYPTLVRRKRFIEKVEVGDKTLFRLQTSGFKNLEEAKAFCLTLAANDVDCITATLN